VAAKQEGEVGNEEGEVGNTCWELGSDVGTPNAHQARGRSTSGLIMRLPLGYRAHNHDRNLHLTDESLCQNAAFPSIRPGSG
jgi:hypothetical protein